jgi:DNA-binding GntR family transcriptional regulator
METLASARAGVKRPLNLRESVYQLLRSRIQMGDIGLDERLVDLDIAKRLNISRMPVREALMQLKSEGALESTSRGFVLRRYTLQEMNDAFEVRFLLEPHAAAVASEQADPSGLNAMEEALNAAREAQALADESAFLRGSAAFRKSWLDMVPNRALVGTIERFFDHVHVVRLATMRDPGLRSLYIEGMSDMHQAFVLGDAALVRERMGAQVSAVAVRYNAGYAAAQNTVSS